MVSRSTRSKLKICFLANLIVLAVAIPSYFYFNSLISKPAIFKVTDLVFENWVQIGTPLEISVNVTNIGEKNGSHLVILSINDVPWSSRSVQLSAAETKTLSFTDIELAMGNFTIVIEDLAGSIRVTSEAPIKPAKLMLMNLGISRKEAWVGEPLTISVLATNIGDIAGEFSIDLFVNNEKRETKIVHLDAGKTKTIEFEVVETVEGKFTVRLEDLLSSFSITSDAQPVKPAEFQVTQITVTPSSVLVDEVAVISAKVINVGEAPGEYAVNLKIDGVTRYNRNVTLSGGATTIVEFQVSETNPGTHTFEIDGITGSFTVEAPVIASDDIRIYDISVEPYEVWEGETVIIKAKTKNLANKQGTLHLKLLVNDKVEATQAFTLAASETDVPIEFSITAGPPNDYTVKLINLCNPKDTFSRPFQVVPTGFHTLSLSTRWCVGFEFTLNGENHPAPYSELLPVGIYTITVPIAYEGGGQFWNWSSWFDGQKDRTRVVDLTNHMPLVANYLNTASCPSLYVWNGKEYEYTAEIADGTGYLGIFDHFQEDGSLAFFYSIPWDYIKLNTSQLEAKDCCYDMTIRQNWDEIAYVDSAKLVIVDHSPDVDVYSTKATYLYEPEGQGTIYTVSKNLDSPLSCINGTGHDVLSVVSERDGITTFGNEFKWDTLELNLGDLSEAEEIKLVVAGTIIYSTGEEQGAWAGQFWDKPGEQPFPPPYMEVKDAEGNWVPVPDNRQFPLLDVIPDCFVVNLTGVFLTNDYSLRINTFFDTRFDYVGVDTISQEDISIQELTITSATLSQAFTTNSTSTGNFTRYGEVTALIEAADDMFVIMRQGDEIHILFPADLPPAPESMERSHFLFASVWFKVNGLPYLDFTVEPLPFHNMTCFLYREKESYPYDAAHLAYLREFNTRIIENP